MNAPPNQLRPPPLEIVSFKLEKIRRSMKVKEHLKSTNKERCKCEILSAIRQKDLTFSRMDIECSGRGSRSGYGRWKLLGGMERGPMNGNVPEPPHCLVLNQLIRWML